MVPPTRRRVLSASVAATALLAGCPGDDGSATSPTGDSTPAETATETPTSDPTATETATEAPEAQFDCAAAERPEPDGSGDDDVGPIEYPDRPDGEPDADWAAAYEDAYFRNSYVQEDWGLTEWEGLTLEDSRVEDHPEGSVVWNSFTVAYRNGDDERVVEQVQTAGYYVDDRGVRRVGAVGELPGEMNLHPAVDGQTVECY